MAYQFLTHFNSPNHGPVVVPHPASLCILHWWGAPSGQSFEGTIRWLCDPASELSAHAVATPGRVACIVPWQMRAWANGTDWANDHAISVECDPNDIEGTIATVVEWLADMVRQGNLTADFQLKGHRDFFPTECPGRYYGRLGEIRSRVSANLAGIPITQGDNMTPELAARLDQIVAWLDTNFRALAAQADANRDTLAQWTVDRLKETVASIPNVDTDKIVAQLADAQLIVQLPATAQLRTAPIAQDSAQ